MAVEPNNGKILPITAGKLWDDDCLMQQYFPTITALDTSLKPEEIGRNENINLLYELFNKLDDEYDFQLGTTLLSLSSTSQL